eukprot:3941773-Rhodomonas_salina.2
MPQHIEVISDGIRDSLSSPFFTAEKIHSRTLDPLSRDAMWGTRLICRVQLIYNGSPAGCRCSAAVCTAALQHSHPDRHWYILGRCRDRDATAVADIAMGSVAEDDVGLPSAAATASQPRVKSAPSACALALRCAVLTRRMVRPDQSCSPFLLLILPPLPPP